MQHLKNVKDQHGYNTGKCQTALLPTVKTQVALTFKYDGVKLLNRLPTNFQFCESKDIFKRDVKEFLNHKMGAREKLILMLS